MSREAFGQLAEQRREELGYTRGFVATRLVLASGGDYFDSTSIRNIEQGKREITDELFDWLVALLQMDRDEAHEALGVWPEGITAEDIKELRRHPERMTVRQMAAKRTGKQAEGATSAAEPVLSDGGFQSMGTWTVLPTEVAA